MIHFAAYFYSLHTTEAWFTELAEQCSECIYAMLPKGGGGGGLHKALFWTPIQSLYFQVKISLGCLRYLVYNDFLQKALVLE